MQENENNELLEGDINENKVESNYKDFDFYRMYFRGKGAGYFGIWAVNVILTIITLGLYYPWAKASMRKFMWNETSIENDRFVFHGTGKEMFKGFVIVYAAFAMLLLTFAFFPMGVLFIYLFIFLLAPYAIFGAWRYRLSRTSWRGIFFSFDGEMGEFAKLYYKQLLLTIITFGIYGFWMQMKLTRYLFEHSKFGQNRFRFLGKGDNYFSLNLAGMVLSVITLYIYLPWYITERFNYIINNIVVDHDGGSHRLESSLTGKKAFGILFVNMLMLVFTVGLAFPWVIMRQFKMFVESIEIPAEIDLDCLEQDHDSFNDATGDGLLDVLDIGLDI